MRAAFVGDNGSRAAPFPASLERDTLLDHAAAEVRFERSLLDFG